MGDLSAPGVPGAEGGVNEALAIEIVERLWRSGVRTFCVCPGGRNAPIVEVLDALPRDRASVLGFFEERAAAFFALGRARRDRAPVAVVTTSGTAAAELLPAAVEAFYAGVPLVLVTGDRPASYRGTGAPQSIEQADLLGRHVARAIDLDRPGTSWSLGDPRGPVHVNACFDEPLPGARAGAGPLLEERPRGLPPSPADAAIAREVGTFLRSHDRPLVVVGPLDDERDAADVLAFCRSLGAPVIVEASSGLRERVGALRLRGGNLSARLALDRGEVNAVLRLGGVPSFRVWRDLEAAIAAPVLSLSRWRWSGLTRGRHLEVHSGGPLPLSRVEAAISPAAFAATFARDRAIASRAKALVERFPFSEPALVRRLSLAIPRGALVYLGNSLPIREWNEYAGEEDRGLRVRDSRGANGIDGQVSTFLGLAGPDRESWAIVGDLTALYDLASLWALRHLEGHVVRIVVVNNGGGRIFERMFPNPVYQNRHALRFEAWAKLFDADYREGVPDAPLGRFAVVECRPDDAETAAFWTELRRGAVPP
ncbi:MAG: 2-succinyl-5-enolpyruvyl-6-hydroxy-3-cyclohexene-1-carboxylic-acid synthase [Acidobacteriia bacterium]|nr:2-succinyl-5-enolpyruvyl-6-hydroxy-3-cyclohexene-1-carboxylic-acid synthase [Terriglobia bacterium]